MYFHIYNVIKLNRIESFQQSYNNRIMARPVFCYFRLRPTKQRFIKIDACAPKPVTKIEKCTLLNKLFSTFCIKNFMYEPKKYLTLKVFGKLIRISNPKIRFDGKTQLSMILICISNDQDCQVAKPNSRTVYVKGPDTLYY